MCVCMWAGDGLCLEFVCFFFFSVNAKKGKEIHLKNMYVCVHACVCVCIGEDHVRRMCPHFCTVLVSSLFPPSANLGGGSSDIWEQFLSAPAKVVKGLISSHAGAQKKNGFLQELNTIYPSRQVFQDGRQA